ncbi:hypothetical protein HFU84_13935 [Acidithiobacillus sp. CV18-2]|nr:hypothetical protein [Acidithiobacillus sp. CV18-3]MBU2756032.1 hypothetical protein [Acidithiobacillus sp. BN09-2]MBU2778572.1 hypothetical protein [Acidithiobacillus sp. CV18-2]MBU2798486.1 hypothetical protein [Acidithiobacillus sp. VAN18-4]
MDQEKRGRGRPRKHEDRKAAQRAASAAYRARRKARREAPTVSSNVIDLSALAPWRVDG